jgi:nitroreductase
MRKDDGSLNLGGEVTPLMEVLLRRRSVRKYAQGAATEEQVAYVIACARSFVDRAGFSAPRLRVVDGEERQAVIDAATRGPVGIVNPWLPSTRARHLILCGAVYPDQARVQRERAIKEAAMAMQVAILAAAELGLGTCWMAGINHERVELTHPMPDGAKLVAISTLGLPPARRGLSWDALAYHTVSKRRKPLDALSMPERWRDG